MAHYASIIVQPDRKGQVRHGRETGAAAGFATLDAPSAIKGTASSASRIRTTERPTIAFGCRLNLRHGRTGLPTSWPRAPLALARSIAKSATPIGAP
jgi:hypothetical protein